MFGIISNPSPVFSVETEVEGAWRRVLKLLACRPKDLSVYPPELVAKLPVYGDGTQDGTCSKCGCEVTLGPRQAIAYDLAPEEYMVCCMVCATILGIMYSSDPDGEIRVSSLGDDDA